MTERIPIRTRRRSRLEYEHLNETGILPFGDRLELLGQSVHTLRPDEYVTPLALPSARILIADFLP